MFCQQQYLCSKRHVAFPNKKKRPVVYLSCKCRHVCARGVGMWNHVCGEITQRFFAVCLIWLWGILLVLFVNYCLIDETFPSIKVPVIVVINPLPWHLSKVIWKTSKGTDVSLDFWGLDLPTPCCSDTFRNNFLWLLTELLLISCFLLCYEDYCVKKTKKKSDISECRKNQINVKVTKISLEQEASCQMRV